MPPGSAKPLAGASALVGNEVSRISGGRSPGRFDSGKVASRHLRKLEESDATVAIFDNFSAGCEWYLGKGLQSPCVRVVCGDIKDHAVLKDEVQQHDNVYHFASNHDVVFTSPSTVALPLTTSTSWAYIPRPTDRA